MVQFLKVEAKHAPIVNSFIETIDKQITPGDLATCLEDVLSAYSHAVIKSPDNLHKHHGFVANISSVRALISVLRNEIQDADQTGNTLTQMPLEKAYSESRNIMEKFIG